MIKEVIIICLALLAVICAHPVAQAPSTLSHPAPIHLNINKDKRSSTKDVKLDTAAVTIGKSKDEDELLKPAESAYCGRCGGHHGGGHWGGGWGHVGGGWGHGGGGWGHHGHHHWGR